MERRLVQAGYGASRPERRPSPPPPTILPRSTRRVLRSSGGSVVVPAVRYSPYGQHVSVQPALLDRGRRASGVVLPGAGRAVVGRAAWCRRRGLHPVRGGG